MRRVGERQEERWLVVRVGRCDLTLKDSYILVRFLASKGDLGVVGLHIDPEELAEEYKGHGFNV
jgi:hypothetical protein